jgi:hypothetical protein
MNRSDVTKCRQRYPLTDVGPGRDARNGRLSQSGICSTSLHRSVMCTTTALPRRPPMRSVSGIRTSRIPYTQSEAWTTGLALGRIPIQGGHVRQQGHRRPPPIGRPRYNIVYFPIGKTPTARGAPALLPAGSAASTISDRPPRVLPPPERQVSTPSGPSPSPRPDRAAGRQAVAARPIRRRWHQTTDRSRRRAYRRDPIRPGRVHDRR